MCLGRLLFLSSVLVLVKRGLLGHKSKSKLHTKQPLFSSNQLNAEAKFQEAAIKLTGNNPVIPHKTMRIMTAFVTIIHKYYDAKIHFKIYKLY